MGKNLARMEMQIFIEELTRRLPHMRLAEQTFSYLPNTSFRGPEHLWVEWDPAQNPERRDRALLDVQVPVRIGEPSRHTLTRPVVVERVTRLTDRIVKLRLVAPDGSALPRWTPGRAHRRRMRPGRSRRASTRCAAIRPMRALEIAVLHEPDGRGGSAWLHAHAQPGMRLKIRGPRNHFRMDESAGKAIFIAGGIGITPIARWRGAHVRSASTTSIHYSGRSRGRHGAARRTGRAARRAPAGSRLRRRPAQRPGGAARARPTPTPASTPAGRRACSRRSQAGCAHWPDDALRIEHFVSTVGALDPSREHAFDAELKDSGLVVARALPTRRCSQALRAANIDVQSDCEEGLCGSCEVRVLAGEVDHRDVVLTRAEREAERQDDELLLAGSRRAAACSSCEGASSASRARCSVGAAFSRDGAQRRSIAAEAAPQGRPAAVLHLLDYHPS